MFKAARIKSMSEYEQLEDVARLKNSISNDSDSVVSAAWRGEILARRPAKIEAGKSGFLTLRQLKKRLDNRRK
jgi:hypothetical protein